MKSHFQLGTAALEFDLHQRQAIDQDGHVIAVVALGRHADLIGYLKHIPAPVITIEETEIKRFSGCLNFSANLSRNMRARSTMVPVLRWFSTWSTRTVWRCEVFI
jgi:hypothetical protein